MLTFRDRTFCPKRYHKHCTKQFECGKRLTFSDTMDAQRSGLPIAVYASRPKCHTTHNPELIATDKESGELEGAYLPDGEFVAAKSF